MAATSCRRRRATRVLLASVLAGALLASHPAPGSGKHNTVLNFTVTPSAAEWTKTVIIVTGGRMGSTLVSGLVNCGVEPGCSQSAGGVLANPEVFVSGENGLALWQLFEFEDAMIKGWNSHLSNAGKVNRGGVKNPWYHTPDPKALDAQMRLLVQSYFLQDMTAARIVGFKEVRWYQRSETRPTKKKPETVHSANNLRRFIQWIDKYVPDLHVVFNLRNPKDTAKSGWWKTQAGSLDVVKELHTEIETVYTVLQRMQAHSGSGAAAPKVIMLDYDRDLLTENVSRLYNFLGERFNASLVESVFRSKYSSSSRNAKFGNVSARATRALGEKVSKA